MDLCSERDLKLVVGVAAAAASRHFFKKRQLWPWRISTLLAWPALGLAVMDTVIGMQAPKEAVLRKVSEGWSPEQAEGLRLAQEELREHMRTALQPGGAAAQRDKGSGGD